jgi:pSer/pThr/pTyr-binding forkhead associated (FHA) protein
MARLVISDGSTSRTVELTDATTVAGRAPENKVVIDDKQASRRHFTIEKIDFGFKLVDLESRNGTRVNDRQVNQMLLRPGDRIQIGRHTLTFEDPNFREPPAEVAARLAPPPAAAPESPSDRSPLPVATEAPKPVPAGLPPAPAPEPDYRKKRNPSGHTTAVQKNVHHQLREEQKTLTMVAVGAGVFIFVVLILIFIPSHSSGELVASKGGGPKPPPGVSDQDRAEKDAHDFEELSNFCERNKNTATAFSDIIKRVDEFEKTHPRSPSGAKARDYRAAAVNGMKTSRNAEFTEAERQAQEDLKKSDFGGALKRIQILLVKYKTDADIHERLAKLKDQAIEEARSYFLVKSQEADAMKFSRKDEAREAYQAILKMMGNGLVPELDVYCRICRVSIEGLQ